MKLNINLRNSFFAAAIAALGLLTGCQPDEVTNGNPLTMVDMDAAFTAATTDGNNYTFNASNDANIQYHTWKYTYTGTFPVGNLAEVKEYGNTKSMTFVFPGTYTVQHRVVGRTGGTNFVSEQTFVVTNLLLGENIVSSPNFENAADWHVFNTSGSQTVTWAFNNGSATASGGVANAWSGQGLYQAVQVEAGTYRVDMHVQGPGGMDQTWFQVFVGATQPVNGSDYGSDATTMLGLNTWAGCGIAPFNGMLSAVGCQGTGTNVTFTQPGTAYIAFKAGTGSNNGVTGITVSDISMRKLP
ncbi:hypothetical protein HYN59_05895 [Flavobacterium album]|uniref:PKD domain-containing protein n=1 Tax=Flavobacterium album TaxID=2175091 RepID=A0A2S1QWG8_9FLAO|nr:hypothetical protein [Flavobacterium album]AWH84679.1 hypothetical protein HYN59_05895 [Flavobacterium album]